MTKSIMAQKNALLCFAFFFALLAQNTPLGAQTVSRIYVADFQIKGIAVADDSLGIRMAQNFEKVLDKCKRRFVVAPRQYYTQRINQLQTFQEKRFFLLSLGLEYVMYGDISYDESSRQYKVQYVFEQLKTAKTLISEQLYFRSLADLQLDTYRLLVIENQLFNHNEFCKRPKALPDANLENPVVANAAPSFYEAHHLTDTDADGIADLLDQESNSPPNADVDQFGRTIAPDGDPAQNGILTKRNAYETMYPTLPTIAYEEGAVSIAGNDQMKLLQVADLMRRYPMMRVVITGTDQASLDRAELRAQGVRAYLIATYALDGSRFETASKITDIPFGYVHFEVSEGQLGNNSN